MKVWHLKEFLDNYFDVYKKLAFDPAIYPVIDRFRALALRIQQSNNKLMLAGNGASATISAHGAFDFTKQGKVRATTFNEPGLITCFSNDYGYENWVGEAIKSYADAGDAVVLISVSGSSPNVVNAAKVAKQMGLDVVAFTGRHADNPLRKLADIDFWVDSHAYNIVEGIHSIWLTAVIDAVIGKSVYET